MNKFGTTEIPKLIRELRFQENRHRAFDEERLADLLRDAADSLEGIKPTAWKLEMEKTDSCAGNTHSSTSQGADGRQAPMTEPLEDEAMSIIRRAAVLLKERGDGCCTPGAHYETNLSLPNEMSIKVTLSEEQSARLQEQIEKHPYRVPYMDNVLHDYFQVAVAKILAGDVI